MQGTCLKPGCDKPAWSGRLGRPRRYCSTACRSWCYRNSVGTDEPVFSKVERHKADVGKLPARKPRRSSKPRRVS